MTDRDETIAGLRVLADFLESHPELPLPRAIDASPHIRGTDEQERAEVDRIAGILGTRPSWSSARRTHYETVRSFGGSVTYSALAITEAHMAAYTEHMEKFDHGAGAADA